jgi:hypothetical protein
VRCTAVAATRVAEVAFDDEASPAMLFDDGARFVESTRAGRQRGDGNHPPFVREHRHRAARCRSRRQ